jgi:uncharacterized protein (TIGR01244 family)
MQTLRINPSLSVADQVEERDVESLAAAGFKCLICNRPDSEGGTPSERIRAACERHGIKFFLLPVVYSGLDVADGDAFGKILQQCEQPALAYCRSGRRSAALWAIAAAPLAGAQAVDELGPVLARSAARADPPYASNSDPGARERFTRLWVQER